MVQRQGLPGLAAVLALKTIPLEGLTASQSRRRQGTADLIEEPNHGRQIEGDGGGPDIPHAVLQQLSLAFTEQHDGSPNRADVQRLVVLVQQ